MPSNIVVPPFTDKCREEYGRKSTAKLREGTSVAKKVNKGVYSST